MKFIGAFALVLLFAGLRLEAQTLDERIDHWRSQVARFCGEHPAKDDCDDGDSVIFNGLLCLSGEEVGCETVRSSQDAAGQFWRSPRRKPGNLGERNSFSRDQTLGVLLYLATARDQGAAIRWMDWIERNKTCSIKNPINGDCIVTLYRVCRDADGEICTISPALWGLMKRVWERIGLEPSGVMRSFENADVSELELAAADREEPGYRLHLKGVASLLRISMNESLARSRLIAQKLFQRQAGNPFFRVLAEGPSEAVLDRVIELCPKPGNDLDFRRHQWTWERADSDEAWRESMGWECVFIGNLLRNSDRIFPTAEDAPPFPSAL